MSIPRKPKLSEVSLAVAVAAACLVAPLANAQLTEPVSGEALARLAPSDLASFTAFYEAVEYHYGRRDQFIREPAPAAVGNLSVTFDGADVVVCFATEANAKGDPSDSVADVQCWSYHGGVWESHLDGEILHTGEQSISYPPTIGLLATDLDQLLGSRGIRGPLSALRADWEANGDSVTIPRLDGPPVVRNESSRITRPWGDIYSYHSFGDDDPSTYHREQGIRYELNNGTVYHLPLSIETGYRNGTLLVTQLHIRRFRAPQVDETLPIGDIVQLLDAESAFSSQARLGSELYLKLDLVRPVHAKDPRGPDQLAESARWIRHNSMDVEDGLQRLVPASNGGQVLVSEKIVRWDRASQSWLPN
jgi:hypothetical protein